VQIAFGQVHSSKAAELRIAPQYDVSMEGPAVVLFCNGDTESARAVPLAGEKKGRALVQLLGEYRGGGKCRQGELSSCFSCCFIEHSTSFTSTAIA
jgi:hypothetical protein